MKIALLSCESSHAEAFSAIIREKGYGLIESIWDLDPRIASQKKKLTSARFYSPILQENLEGIDFALIEGRYSESHFAPAEAALKYKIPVYIDKPTVNSYQEALELNALANKNKVPLVSFTPMTMGSDFKHFKEKTADFKIFTVACPGFCSSINNPKANDLSFYASHGTDILTRLIPVNPIAVRATKTRSSIFVNVDFDGEYIGNLHFPFIADEFYHVIGMKDHFTELIQLNTQGDMYENTIDYLFNSFLKEGWTKNQFTPSLNSMWILDQVRQQIQL